MEGEWTAAKLKLPDYKISEKENKICILKRSFTIT